MAKQLMLVSVALDLFYKKLSAEFSPVSGEYSSYIWRWRPILLPLRLSLSGDEQFSGLF